MRGAPDAVHAGGSCLCIAGRARGGGSSRGGLSSLSERIRSPFTRKTGQIWVAEVISYLAVCVLGAALGVAGRGGATTEWWNLGQRGVGVACRSYGRRREYFRRSIAQPTGVCITTTTGVALAPSRMHSLGKKYWSSRGITTPLASSDAPIHLRPVGVAEA
ncbi:hypothetical protein B0H16DRAFT_1584250 [Mycena metata]|uniref:Uncharacterized protein n=1 Tax=Mycena metata TaxID=1033252 RepID=A0AAD7MTB4_9AGAR|nr:hypothetical protein B0H16DRAFT_1584250 [Mycena metata]